jgi:hypothetical protein
MKSYYVWFNLLKSQPGVFILSVLFVTMMVSAMEVLGAKPEMEKQIQFEKPNISLQIIQTDTSPTQITSGLNDERDVVSPVKNKSIIPSVDQDRGYLVAVTSNKKFKRTITKDPELVVQIFEKNLGTDMDIMKILNDSPFFDMKTDGIYFYAEVGTVREGKKGKLKFKKMKKYRK